MKLTGELKDKVEQTKDLEEAKEVIAGAGMLLSDDEVSEVAGGVVSGGIRGKLYHFACPCGLEFDSEDALRTHRLKSPDCRIRSIDGADGPESRMR